MATEKEEVVLQFKVEQGDAITEMERMKKSIIQTKEEQKALNKAYKEGDITITEYAQETVRLEGILKKQQSTYNNVQKSVTGVKTQLDKLIDSNQKISKDLQKTSQSFQDVAGQINVAGVNVGSLTTKFASFANPVTAAVGVVGALSAAYARSTIGAKDLEFAQNQLNTAITIGTNAFASLISSAEDGEGIISKLTTAILFRIDPVTGTLSKLAALNAERLEDLGRTELEIRAKVNERLEENQELLTDIQSEQTTLNQKLANGDQIITNVRRNEEELKDVLEEELGILNDQLKIDEHNEAIQTAILQKKLEISKLERDSEKRVQNIVKLQDNLNDAEAKRLALLREKASDVTGGRKLQIIVPKEEEADAVQAQSEFQALMTEATITGTQQRIELEAESAKTIETEEQRSLKQRLQYLSNANDSQLSMIQNTAAEAASIFGQQTAAYKILASADAIINTYKGANLALGTYPPPFSYIAAAVTVAAGLANVAKINGAEFAEGGYTGYGFGSPDSTGFKPAGIVHEHEYVVPKRVTYSSAAQPHIKALESMRLSKYAEGGVVTSSMTNQANESLALKNSIKEMAKQQIVVSVKEITRAQNKVQVKERARK